MSFQHKIDSLEVEEMDLANFSGEIQVISNPGKDFDAAIEHLTNAKYIGFDTETKPCFIAKVPRNKMAILQLSSYTNAYIFRLQQLGVPKQLADLMSNPFVLKVGAAVHDDIRGLQSYSYFTPRGFIDLQKLAGEFGIEEKSVRKMSAIILSRKVSKSQQLSNWESAELSSAQLKYAATDAWICLKMFDVLKQEGI